MLDPTLGSAVIDTNILLDWFVFHDPAAQALAHAIGNGSLRWIASPAMRQECDRVITRSSLATWSPDRPSIEDAWRRWAVMMPPPPSPGSLRCTDPDDQMFIDLALNCRSTWLLTRDRALLKLAKPASGLGVHVLTPTHWSSRPMVPATA